MNLQNVGRQLNDPNDYAIISPTDQHELTISDLKLQQLQLLQVSFHIVVNHHCLILFVVTSLQS